MDNSLIVDIEELNTMVSHLLLRLKASKGNSIEIQNDYYWDISKDELYNPKGEPKGLSIGQLSDDWHELKRSISSGTEVVYDLKRVSNLLKALSIENPIAF